MHFADLLTPLRGSTREKVSEQWVPHAPEEIWPYFCDERNLEELTPEFLKFRVLRKSTREIGEGTLIDYRLNLNGIPMGWQSRIENWEPTRRFVDTQVKGPYSHWLHAHEFIPLANGTLMRDVVRYRLPFGWLGSTVAGWKVESQVDQIFSYRAARIAERFGRRPATTRPGDCVRDPVNVHESPRNRMNYQPHLLVTAGLKKTTTCPYRSAFAPA